MITPERANDLTAVNMFLDEARLAASLNHQNVAQVFEVGEDVGIHYLAMEYVHGQDLRAVLAKAGSQGTRIPLELALTVVAGAAAGLNHAHERRGPDGTPLGIVHRDVSPSNIMIGYDGAVKLLDFGIAKATARSVETQSGIIKGKFAYMAPEQCRGREVDRRSDVFSLGIILYEISTQHRCFRADSDFDTMHRIVTGDVVRPTRLVQGYPQALEAIVMKALAVDAAQRYQSAGLLLEAIESFAVSARMSLSTMGLGRFMRDMFGEVQEPWLNTAATKVLQPVVKESTISQTNGTSSPSQPRLQSEPPLELNETGIPEEDDGRFLDSDKMEAAKTILDLPRNPAERHVDLDDQPVEWNAKSYPSTTSALASKDTLRPDANIQSAYPPGVTSNSPTLQISDSPRRSTPQSFPHASVPPPHSSAELPLPAPAHITPPGTPTGRPFTVPSSSGPIPAPLGMPSTKHGYASGGMTRAEVSYPGYTQPGEPAEMELKPNRRPLIIGLLIVLIGAAAIAFVMLRSNNDDQAAAAPEGSGSTETASGALPEGGSGEEDSMVSVIIHSDPPGADVMIAGSKIGVTPLNTKNKRGTSIQQLTVHKDGYADFSTKIDLGGDYENRNVKLTRVEDAKEGSGANQGSDAKAGSGAKAPSTTPDSGASGAKPTTKTGAGGTGAGGATGAGSTGAGAMGAGGATTTKTSPTGTKTKTSGTKSEKSGGEKSGERTGDKASGEKTSGEKSSGEKTSGEKTSGEKTSGEKTSGEKASGEKASGDKASKQPKCQPPGPNVDPFSSVPICKTP